MGRLQQRTLVLASVLGCVLGVSAATSPVAGAVTREVTIDGSVLRVTGAATRNDIEVSRANNHYKVVDNNKTWEAVGPDCSGEGAHTATCVANGAGLSLALDAGGDRDTIRVRSTFTPDDSLFRVPAVAD